jgi:hypothetical protein
MRRIQANQARGALLKARLAANETGIPALMAEVAAALQSLDTPIARLGTNPVRLSDIEALIATRMLIIDACRTTIRSGPTVIPLAGRPVLFALARALGEAWPHAAPREALIARAFAGKEADDSHRARLRVEIGRLRKLLRPLAAIIATPTGFRLDTPSAAVLTPLEDAGHGQILALLADGETWSSASLALALGISARSVQRALDSLAAAGKVESTGKGRACRWIAATVPGFPTSMLLPGPPAEG